MSRLISGVDSATDCVSQRRQRMSSARKPDTVKLLKIWFTDNALERFAGSTENIALWT